MQAMTEAVGRREDALDFAKLRKAQGLTAGQKEALELASSGAPLDQVLTRLASAAAEMGGEGAGAAIFIVDAAGACLRFAAAAGLSEDCTRAIDGYEIGPHAPSCGTAAYTSETVIVGDVARDPLWAPYLDLARQHGIHACWSHPIRAAGGRLLGTIALYHRRPREPEPGDLELIALLGDTAAVVIGQHREALERARAEAASRESQAELEAVTGLHQLAMRLLVTPDVPTASQETLDAVLALMNADMGTAQVYDPEAKGLRFVAQRGFDPAALAAVDVVRDDDFGPCGRALRAGERVIVEDFETDPGSAHHRATASRFGYRAAQSTPLMTRSGEIVGMLTTHFRRPRRPSARELRLIDLYVRQAAHLMERARAEERQKLLLDELNHRVKNTLATIQSIAMQTLNGTAPLAEERDAFCKRLVALSRVHDLLTQDEWQGAGLRELVLGALEPYGGAESPQFTVEGADVRLPPRAALTLGMAFHELATNAVKYGALSNGTGRVDIAWVAERSSEPRRLRLRWSESGGPAVETPQRQGFGTLMIQRALAHDLRGEVELLYDPGGLVCTMDLPLSSSPGCADEGHPAG